MGVLGIVLLVIGIIVAVLVVLVVVLRVVGAKLRKDAETAIDETFGAGEALHSDPMANFFGLDSQSRMQIRGNGALVLTAKQLWFLRQGARAPLEIPLSSVTAVEIVPSHAGKRVGRDLLRVSFASDSAAWYVDDPKLWQERIRSMCPAVS